MKLAILIMAAGKGTRLKSKRPKVLHEIGGKALLRHVMTQPDPVERTEGQGAKILDLTELLQRSLRNKGRGGRGGGAAQEADDDDDAEDEAPARPAARKRGSTSAKRPTSTRAAAPKRRAA